MAQYVSVPIETDPDALAQDAFDYLAAKNPGWTPHDGQLDVWILEANARMASTLRDLASNVPPAIFRYFGKLVGVPPIDAVSATSTATFNLSDSAGHTIPNGTHVGVPDSAGNLIEFMTTADVIVPVGQTVANNVGIAASTPGVAGTNLGVNGTVLTPLDQLVWLTSVTLLATTANGTDAESDDVYLGRLVANLQLMAPRPILAPDFAIMALNIAGVGRALALDGYDAVAATFGNARTVTVAVVDSSGNPTSSAIKNAVQSLLVGAREINFIVYAVDPSYTTIDVQWDVNAWPSVDPVALLASINAAVRSFLNPATWGQPPYGDTKRWYSMTTAKINDIITAIGIVQGVKDVNSVLIRTGAAAYAAADIALAGAAPLAQAGAVTGVVH